MTEQVEVKIPFADLTEVTLQCPDCGAEISLDISKHPNVSDKCPGCAHAIDSKFDEAFSRLREWYLCLKDSSFGDKMFFRIKK